MHWAVEVFFSLHKSHIDSIHLHRQCRSHHHPWRYTSGSTWSSPSMKDHSSATTWRGALASSIDQLERLPKTASHPFTYRALPVGAVSTGLLYISLFWALKGAYSCSTHVGFKSKQKHGDQGSQIKSFPVEQRGTAKRGLLGCIYQGKRCPSIGTLPISSSLARFESREENLARLTPIGRCGSVDFGFLQTIVLGSAPHLEDIFFSLQKNSCWNIQHIVDRK